MAEIFSASRPVRVLSESEYEIPTVWTTFASSYTLSAWGQVSSLGVSTVHAVPGVIHVQAPRGQRWLPTVLERLEVLAALDQKDWDREGAQPISPIALGVSAQILWHLMSDETAAPNVLPDPDGGVNLSWRVNDVELDIEVSPEGAAEVTFEGLSDQDSLEGDLESLLPRVLAVMPRLSMR